MTPQEQAEEMARRCAASIQTEWEVGSTSRFCDDAPDFDLAEEDEIVKIILQQIPLVELLNSKANLDRASSIHSELQEIIGEKCFPAQMPRFLGDFVSNLRAQNAALLEVAKAADTLNKEIHGINPFTFDDACKSLVKSLTNLRSKGVNL